MRTQGVRAQRAEGDRRGEDLPPLVGPQVSLGLALVQAGVAGEVVPVAVDGEGGSQSIALSPAAGHFARSRVSGALAVGLLQAATAGVVAGASGAVSHVIGWRDGFSTPGDSVRGGLRGGASLVLAPPHG